MRSAEMIQTLSRILTSSHPAPMLSPVLAAVRIVNSRARVRFLPPRAPNPGSLAARRRAAPRVLDLAHLGARRQELGKMAGPAARVLAPAVAAVGRPIQNGLHAAAEPAGGLRLRRPDRFDHLHHQRRVDRLHREVADDRIGVGLKRRRPLGRVLLVSPAGWCAAMYAVAASLNFSAFAFSRAAVCFASRRTSIGSSPW
jgi:hypothetical protein